MPESKPADKKSKPRKKLWRRLLRFALWTFLFLVIAHRPLIIYGGPALARMLARKQHIDVSFALSGTIFSNLTVSNVKVKPTGTGPTPIQSISIDRIRADYSLWRLIREGVGWFISSYELHHVNLDFVALPSKTEEEKEKKKSIAETLRLILTQPAAYSDRVWIEDFNLRVKSPTDETALLGLNLLLHPTDPGYMRIDRLKIPGLPAWENLNSATSYVGRNLYQRNLRLTPDITIDELNFDASRRAEGTGSISLTAHAFGGEAKVNLTGQELPGEGDHLPKRYDTHLTVSVRDVSVRSAVKYFAGGDLPFDKLGQLDIDFLGDPEMPQSWQGLVAVRIDDIAAGGLRISEVSTKADFKKGTATLLTSVGIGTNSVKLDAKVGLPRTIDGWLDSEIDGTLAVDAPALKEILGAFTKANTAGTVAAKAQIGVHSRVATVDLALTARDTVFDTFSLTTGDVKLKARKAINPDDKRPLAGLTADVKVNADKMQAGTFAIDIIQAAVSAENNAVNLSDVTVRRGANHVVIKANATLPDDLTKTNRIVGASKVDIQIPALADFGIVVNGEQLGGTLHTTADVAANSGRYDGSVQISGGNFSLGNFKTGALTGSVKLAGDSLELTELSLAFTPSDRLVISAKGTPNAPFAYEGNVQLGFNDLNVLQPLLAVFKVADPLHGKLEVDWKGRGGINDKKHSGAGKIALTKASFGTTKIDSFAFGGEYTADAATAELSAASGPTKLNTQLVWANEEVKLRDLELRQGDQKAMTGEISYSLAHPADQPLDPLRQPLHVALHTDRLDVEKVMSSLGKPAPAAGLITLNLAVTGTAVRPDVELVLTGRGLKSKAAAQLDPAELDLKLKYQPSTLDLNATVRQSMIQPLTVRANAPLDVERVIVDKKVPSDLPLDVSVKLPNSSLAVLPKLTPAVRRADGTVALDVHVGGTIEKPQLTGSANVSLKEARLSSEAVPAIGQFDARLVFTTDTLRFERFRGEVGGGTFDLLGSVNLAKLDDPAFDLTLTAREILVKRDDSITVRSDADIKVGGTLKAGALTGQVAVTQSRFFKEIDILPIGLPGKPKPAPKSAPSEPVIILPDPLDKWKIDLRIITKPDDPFLVRGNVANGSVTMDVRVGNTGSQPWLDGAVTIDQFTTSLPFSRLNIEGGHVYFTKNKPLLPVLDIQATSKIRDYTVTAYIFGSAYQPQIQFSSEPPLPHGDIVSLLATGSTTADIASNADMLASRAALLALQSLWRKIVKPKSAPPPGPRSKQGDTSFFDRFELELGGTDNATGAREATAKFRINDQLYLLGELDTQGRYTGSLKYLLRFR